MNINEVYAINIQPRTIIKATDCKPEEVEQERGKFLEWMNKVGKKFLSQMDAWAVYSAGFFDWSKYLVLENPHDTKEIDWTRDLEDAWRASLRPANYDEFGGQQ